MTCPPGYYQPAGSENVMDSCSMCEPGKPCSGELVWSSCEAYLVVPWQARFKPKKDRSRALHAPSSALGSLIRRPHQCAHNARRTPNLPNVWMKWIKCTAATELACKPNNFVASSGRFHSRLMRRPRRCKDGYFNKNRRAVCQHAALCLLATARLRLLDNSVAQGEPCSPCPIGAECPGGTFPLIPYDARLPGFAHAVRPWLCG